MNTKKPFEEFSNSFFYFEEIIFLEILEMISPLLSTPMTRPAPLTTGSFLK